MGRTGQAGPAANPQAHHPLRALPVLALAAILVLAGCAGSPRGEVDAWPAGSEPAAIGRRLAENLLARLPLEDYTTPAGIAARRSLFPFGDPFGHPQLHYAEMCTADGALNFAGKSQDRALLDRLVVRYGPLRRSEGAVLYRYHSHVDTAVFAIVPICIYRHTGDRGWLRLGLDYADRQWEEGTTCEETLRQRTSEGEGTLPPGLSPQTRWWIDDMYMFAILQAEAFKATGERRYVDRAAEELVAYVDRLQQPSGLFHHAPNAPWFWGRGNGWVASGLTEVLAVLPGDHPRRPRLLAAYRLMMAALLQHQAPEGLWRQIIDRPDAWLESSCTAMFGNAIATGVKRGWLDAGAYAPAYRAAWLGLVGRLDAQGNVGEVCEGTNKSPAVEPYYQRRRLSGDFHGQAPLMWFATTLLD